MAFEICTFLFMAKNANAAEPNSIGELLKAKGAEWLIGEWETKTEKGDKVEFKFLVSLNGYIIDFEGGIGSAKGKGIVYYDQNKKSIFLNGINNNGDILTGTFEIENGRFVMNLERAKADGNITKFIRYVSKIDSETMRSETFVLTDGKKPEQPTGVFEFKRKK